MRLKLKYIPLLLFCSIFNFPLSAQEFQLSEVIQSIVEDLADNDSDPGDPELLAEKLLELSERPVNLNSADESELSRLFFLTDFQIKSLADYQKSSGKIYTVYELAAIPGFNRDLAGMIVPFITLGSESEPAKDTFRLKSSLLSNFYRRVPSSGNSSSFGSPVKILMKYRLDSGRYTAGLTAEKDPGEKLISGKLPLPDFCSFNIAMTGGKILKKLIIGDFSAHFGLGTNINTGLRTGLSLTSAGYLSGSSEIKPYTSSDENNFFRGVAAGMQFGKLGAAIFCSSNKIDATVDTSMDGERTISSFLRTGIHDNVPSCGKKDAVREYCCGLNIRYDFKRLSVGVIWSENAFSIPVKITGDDPEDLFRFEGNRNSIMSASYKAVVSRLILYGEASADSRRNLAMVQGFSFRPSDRLTLNLLLRNYDPGYAGFHGKGPFASSSGDNICGIFGNFNFEAAKYLFIGAGCDIRFYPWLKYRCSAPSEARSSEIKARYIPGGKLTAELSYNYRYSELDDPEAAGIKKQEAFISRTFKCSARYSLTDRLVATSRFDLRFAKPGDEKGMMLLQDISWKCRKYPFSLWFRYCIFRTTGWNSRIYAYENDLPGVFNVPALSGEGSRCCLMAGWEPMKRVSIRIKYSVSEKMEVTGTDSAANDFRFQIRLWF